MTHSYPDACRRGFYRLQKSALAAGLAIAFPAVNANEAVSPLPRDIPLEWPLPYERNAATTPLRARLDAMRISRPGPTGHRSETIFVTNCADDDSAGSLRTTVETATSGDIVDLSNLACSHISLSQGALKIELDELTLRGPGANLLTLDGLNQDRIILHPGSGSLSIENLTIANGRFEAVDTDIGFGGCVATGASLRLRSVVIRNCLAIGVGSYGGAVLSGFMSMIDSTISGSTAFGDHPTNGTAAYGGGAFSYGVDIIDSSISGNSAIGTDNAPLTHWEIGGGLFVARNGGSIERTTISDNFAIRFAGGLTQEGDLVLRNSTISGNTTEQDDGGGLRVRQFTSVLIENSTITGNHAGSSGGGVSFIDNALDSGINSTIISGNSAGLNGADVNSSRPLSISGSHNVVRAAGSSLTLPGDTLDVDPLLLPLGDNGGPTLTHALGTGSPAINHGSNPQDRSTDQRGVGYSREVDGSADIGAYEVQGAPPGPTELPANSIWASGLMASLLALLGLRRKLPARNWKASSR
ncbi:choice-of-anchor Q domain-containing protein [Dokdonella sp.]|uniref:choice-of-anchor Q domain-containing protein n=1 Tax=Dokdonella sp. TaxID=2291710 RepID=UPI003C37B472